MITSRIFKILSSPHTTNKKLSRCQNKAFFPKQGRQEASKIFLLDIGQLLMQKKPTSVACFDQNLHARIATNDL